MAAQLGGCGTAAWLDGAGMSARAGWLRATGAGRAVECRGAEKKEEVRRSREERGRKRFLSFSVAYISKRLRVTTNFNSSDDRQGDSPALVAVVLMGELVGAGRVSFLPDYDGLQDFLIKRRPLSESY